MAGLTVETLALMEAKMVEKTVVRLVGLMVEKSALMEAKMVVKKVVWLVDLTGTGMVVMMVLEMVET